MYCCGSRGGVTPGVSGQVTIVMGSGAKSFEGMDRNGVKSSSYGPADSSYSFIKNSEPGHIEYATRFGLGVYDIGKIKVRKTELA